MLVTHWWVPTAAMEPLSIVHDQNSITEISALQNAEIAQKCGFQKNVSISEHGLIDIERGEMPTGQETNEFLSDGCDIHGNNARPNSAGPAKFETSRISKNTRRRLSRTDKMVCMSIVDEKRRLDNPNSAEIYNGDKEQCITEGISSTMRTLSATTERNVIHFTSEATANVIPQDSHESMITKELTSNFESVKRYLELPTGSTDYNTSSHSFKSSYANSLRTEHCMQNSSGVSDSTSYDMSQYSTLRIDVPRPPDPIVRRARDAVASYDFLKGNSEEHLPSNYHDTGVYKNHKYVHESVNNSANNSFDTSFPIMKSEFARTFIESVKAPGIMSNGKTFSMGRKASVRSCNQLPNDASLAGSPRRDQSIQVSPSDEQKPSKKSVPFRNFLRSSLRLLRRSGLTTVTQGSIGRTLQSTPDKGPRQRKQGGLMGPRNVKLSRVSLPKIVLTENDDASCNNCSDRRNSLPEAVTRTLFERTESWTTIYDESEDRSVAYTMILHMSQLHDCY